jgi:hypothetical protein
MYKTGFKEPKIVTTMKCYNNQLHNSKKGLCMEGSLDSKNNLEVLIMNIQVGGNRC